MLTTGRVGLEKLLEERISSAAKSPRGESTSKWLPGTKRVIAIPMADDEEIIRCIADVLERELADFVLVGKEDDVRRRADSCGVSVDGARFEFADSAESACRLTARLAASGEADILMKGRVHTADFVRAILDRRTGLLDEGRLLSHVAVLDIPAYPKLLVITDAAINVEPDLEQKLAIIDNALRIARSVGVSRPKIACVAPAETPSPHIRSTMDAAEIRRLFDAGRLLTRFGDVEIDGPFALDVAISREAARVKKIDSSVAGDADILLMPNLDSGNALYKSLTYFAGAHIAGVVAGARVPIVLTSRSDSEQNKYCSVLLALAGAGIVPPRRS